jgi:hypothetical protein
MCGARAHACRVGTFADASVEMSLDTARVGAYATSSCGL